MLALKISNLKKYYQTPEGEKKLVVHIPNFQLQTKEQVVLQGISGCGKTTLLHLIAGILQADEGQIEIAHQNMPISESKRDRWRASYIGYIFQNFNLLQGYTALENVLLPMLFTGKQNVQWACHLLERVGLKNRLDYYPSQLSVGQQQRVAVARALANRPKLILADEPTGSLDTINSQEVIELIKQICQENEAALLLVTHDAEIAKQFSQHLEMQHLNKI